MIDLHAQTVLPELTDAHCHIFGIGERELNLNLKEPARAQTSLPRSERFARPPTDGSQAVVGLRLSGIHQLFPRQRISTRLPREVRCS